MRSATLKAQGISRCARYVTSVVLTGSFRRPAVTRSLHICLTTTAQCSWLDSWPSGVSFLKLYLLMMMSQHGSTLHITGPLWGESTGDQASILQNFDDFLLLLAWINCWTNSQVACDINAITLMWHHCHHSITFDSDYSLHVQKFCKSYA